jgi:hypothetical protein
MSGKAQNEHITSGFPATADIERTSSIARLVPDPDNLVTPRSESYQVEVIG